MAAADFTVKANDTEPSIQATLTSGGSPIGLTGSTVKFILADKTSGAVKVNAAAVVVDAAAGIVRYDWDGVAGDTDTPASYQAEWEITDSDGGVRTVPTTTYITVDVLADLDGGV